HYSTFCDIHNSTNHYSRTNTYLSFHNTHYHICNGTSCINYHYCSTTNISLPNNC
ncbi:hypothetical protein ACJMK2_024181, partial [Sinanodonta woodiana]